jgi:hypothetical protein
MDQLDPIQRSFMTKDHDRAMRQRMLQQQHNQAAARASNHEAAASAWADEPDVCQHGGRYTAGPSSIEFRNVSRAPARGGGGGRRGRQDDFQFDEDAFSAQGISTIGDLCRYVENMNIASGNSSGVHTDGLCN